VRAEAGDKVGLRGVAGRLGLSGLGSGSWLRQAVVLRGTGHAAAGSTRRSSGWWPRGWPACEAAIGLGQHAAIWSPDLAKPMHSSPPGRDASFAGGGIGEYTLAPGLRETLHLAA